MNEALQKLPLTKREELQNITKLLSNIKEVDMVILFGGYARGQYVENDILYEYKSDYDLLVITYHDNLKAHLRIETKVNEVLRDTGIVKTPISLIFHSGKHGNTEMTCVLPNDG